MTRRARRDDVPVSKPVAYMCTPSAPDDDRESRKHSARVVGSIRWDYNLCVSGRRMMLIAALAVVSLVALTILPIGHRTAAYRAADSVSDTRDDLIVLNVPRFSDPPLFRIENGRLYLLIQDLRHALLITTMAGSGPGWTNEALTRFRAEHPELEAHWPKPQQPDAGVVWVAQR